MIHLAASLWLIATPATEASIGPCGYVRGRMFLANGAPSVRIWVVGTKRILGVTQQDVEFEKLPQNIRQAWRNKDGVRDGGEDLYGDFSICPLTKSKAGRMQFVWVRSGKNLVVRPERPPTAR